MPTKDETKRVLRILNLPTTEYAVCGGALLAEHELRDNPRDIDLLVSQTLFEKIKPLWHEYSHGSDEAIKTPQLFIDSEIIEAFPSIDFVDYKKAQEYISRAENRDGIPFVRLQDMLDWKRLVVETRPKNKKNDVHRADIALIEESLKCSFQPTN